MMNGDSEVRVAESANDSENDKAASTGSLTPSTSDSLSNFKDSDIAEATVVCTEQGHSEEVSLTNESETDAANEAVNAVDRQPDDEEKSTEQGNDEFRHSEHEVVFIPDSSRSLHASSHSISLDDIQETEEVTAGNITNPSGTREAANESTNSQLRMSPIAIQSRRRRRRCRTNQDGTITEGTNAASFIPPMPDLEQGVSESPYAERLRRKQETFPSMVATTQKSSKNSSPANTNRTYNSVHSFGENSVEGSINSEDENLWRVQSLPTPASNTQPSTYAARLRRKQSQESTRSNSPAVSSYAARLRRKQSQESPSMNTTSNHSNRSTNPTAPSYNSRLRRKQSQESSNMNTSSSHSTISTDSVSLHNSATGINDSRDASTVGMGSTSSLPSLAAEDGTLNELSGRLEQENTANGNASEIQLPALHTASSSVNGDIELPGNSEDNWTAPSGMLEGDQVADAFLNGATPVPVFRHLSSVTYGTRQESLSSIPVESRGLERIGSFISGGQGPLMSDQLPGAFQARGRAFGDLPRWLRESHRSNLTPATVAARGALMQQLSSRSLPVRPSHTMIPAKSQHDLRQLRMMTPEGSFTVRALYQRTSTLTPESDGLAVARATLLEGSATGALLEGGASAAIPEGDREEPESPKNSQRDTVVNPSEAAYDATPVNRMSFVDAQEVTNEEVLDAKNTRLAAYGVCCMVLLLSIVLIILLLLWKASGSDDTPITTSALDDEPLLIFPRHSDLPDLESKCDSIPSSIFTDFSPVLECYCGREIPGIPSAIIDAHSRIIQVLIERRIVRFPPRSTDCDDPRNLSLLWLAEAEPNFESAETMITRYLLGVLFHSMNGFGWETKTRWLTTQSECLWYGVSCNADLAVQEIQLPSNALNGTFPSEIFDMSSLRLVNITNNKLVLGDTSSGLEELIDQGLLLANGTELVLIPEKRI